MKRTVAALTAQFRARVGHFCVDQSGAVLIYVTMMMPVLVGLGVLAVDFSRLSNLNTGLQKGADALALAGAAELDRKPDSIARATAAINNLVVNQHKFSTSGATNVSVTIRFLTTLPPDADPITSTNVVAAPGTEAGSISARFVEVTTNTPTLNTIFPASLLGGANTVTTRATAVAGFNTVMCKSVPMFICNPYEGTSTSLFTAAKTREHMRKQIKLQLGSGGESQYFPGNYGWLDTPSFGPGSNGANALRDALAKVNSEQCWVQNAVSQRTGNIESANAAINTRFDLWDGPFNGDKNNAAYLPDENVRKGYDTKSSGKGKGGGDACNVEPSSPNTNKLGQDSAFPDAGGRLGNGVWPFTSYWSNNFGTTPPNGWNDTEVNRPSRYEVYRYEIDNLMTGTAAVAGNAVGEKGKPYCAGETVGIPNRRILYAAVIDCQQLDLRGNSSVHFAVKAFAKFFLTEPVGADGIIYAEMIDLVEPGNSSKDIVRDQVQLYR